ncbi:hypothetical protein SEA_TARSUSIV_86 [Mycobacterium phage TarsusIV]|nr:hypothetical protein SEA_TARSUSIV_86 [Mycobacterium phage TarsusIV]
MTVRTAERLQALSYILSDGLHYSWFYCTKLDDEACTATIRVDRDGDDEGTFGEAHEIGPDDIARGLRMFREYARGERELYVGEWELKRKRDPEYKPSRARDDWYGWQLVEFDRTNGEEGDYDADTADMVLQFAIFGEVRFG